MFFSTAILQLCYEQNVSVEVLKNWIGKAKGVGKGNMFTICSNFLLENLNTEVGWSHG